MTDSERGRPETIVFEADGKEHTALVSLPTRPVRDQMIREVDGVKYAICIPLGSVPGHPDINFIARPVDESLV